MKIVVLAGGWSPERNVSWSSGTLIANALIRKGHRVLLLDSFLGLPEAEGQNAEDFFRTQTMEPPEISKKEPDLQQLRRQAGNPRGYIGPEVLRLCEAADVVYMALHGDMGENGQIQALLDLHGVVYTGTGYIGSLLAMDKDLSKRLLHTQGVLTPEWLYLDMHDERLLEKCRQFGLPLAVKPCSCGSSVGVSLIETWEGLEFAVRQAFSWADHIIVERRIYGRELTAAVLDGEVLPPVEILPQDGFYDYEHKYQTGATTELCPAPIDSAVLQTVRETSKKAFSILRLRDYARFDYILDREDRLWCLEANSLPGMTPNSLLPRMAAEAGIGYENLCDTVVKMAASRK
ncbi:MAG: D-alanine--D-alanine ligase [Clostridia bacterium]|nr:D-alanine--D-alanine ligase [Clostridia bacterium]